MSLSDQNLILPCNTKPTIMQIIPSLKTGGVEIEALEIGKAITQSGWNSIIAAKIHSKDLMNLSDEIEFIDLPLDSKNPFQLYKNTKILKKIILQRKVDIVHLRSRAPAWSSYFVCHSLGIPVVTTYHAAYQSKSFIKDFYNSIMARGHRVIAISEFIKNHLTQKYAQCSWFKMENLRLIERGIDLNRFNPEQISQTAVQELRKSWGIRSKTRIVLLPGRMSRIKGQELLIKAASLLKQKEIAVVFLGPTDGLETYRDKLLSLAHSLGLEGKVKFANQVFDIVTAYKVADIVVCPTLVPEGFGRTMAEAQAMEKPIIAAKHGAALEIIDEGKTGWFFTPKDPIALAKVLEIALTQSQKENVLMGKKGRERIAHLFTAESMASKTMSVYKELIEKM